MKCDVSKQEEIVGMFETIKEKHGGVDLCVNNAGLAHDAPLLSGCYDQWRDMLDVCKQVLIIYLVKPYYFCILNTELLHSCINLLMITVYFHVNTQLYKESV